MSDTVLALNAGSSSLKFAVFAAGDEPDRLLKGQVERLGVAPRLAIRGEDGSALLEREWPDGKGLQHEYFLPLIFDWLDDHLGSGRMTAVGHRIVHGGTRYAAPVRVDAEVRADLETLIPLAPLHQGHNLAALAAAQAARPGLPQVACFDTAFHRTQPEVATRFALPARYEAEGVRRYGFHGVSYEYIARRLTVLDPALVRGRVIAAHLGNGASLCAMKGGRSVDTTMGFTTLDGLVMGTRAGALDPGVILHLIQRDGLAAADVEDLLYRRSGLLGVSSVSSDMRELLASGAAPARAAVELFVYRLAREAGALASSLGGLDGFVFTAGIGENSPEIRAAACARLAWLGAELDADANAAGAPVISTPSSRVRLLVIPTDEERMIAAHALAVIGRA